TPEQQACWRALADYLSAALRYQPTVEVFTFCSGDEFAPPERQRAAAPADFLTDRTLFDLRQRIVVSDPDARGIRVAAGTTQGHGAGRKGSCGLPSRCRSSGPKTCVTPTATACSAVPTARHASARGTAPPACSATTPSSSPAGPKDVSLGPAAWVVSL